MRCGMHACVRVRAGCLLLACDVHAFQAIQAAYVLGHAGYWGWAPSSVLHVDLHYASGL